MLFARSDLFTVLSTQIWIHRLYLRIAFPTMTAGDEAREWTFASMISIPPSPKTPRGERYLTEVTCEGDGLGPGAGVWADADVYIGGEPPQDHSRSCTGAGPPACTSLSRPHARPAVIAGHVITASRRQRPRAPLRPTMRPRPECARR